MKYIALAEILSSLYVGVSIVAQYFADDGSVSARRMRLCSAFTFLWLIVDALSYLVTGPYFGSYMVVGVLNFAAFTMGSLIMIVFMGYAEAHIRERAPLGPWTFGAPMVCAAVCAAVIAFRFLTGRIMLFDAGGIKTVGGIPAPILVVLFALLFYSTVVAFLKRRYVGTRTVVIVGVYSILPAVTIIMATVMEYDLTPLSTAFAVTIVADLLQIGLINKRRKEAEKANLRIDALHKISRSAPWSIGLDAQRGILECQFPTDLAKVLRNEFRDDKDWIEAIHPEDRARVLDGALAALNDESGHALFDAEYRVRARDGAYHWVRSAGQVVFTPGVGGEMYGMCIDVDDVVRRREEDRRRLEEALAFTNYFIDTFVSSYAVNLETRAYKVYRRNDRLTRDYPVVSDYVESLRAYIDAEVHPDDRSALIEFIQPENLKTLLRKSPIVTHSFRSCYDGEEQVFVLRVARGADEHSAAFAFIDYSEMAARERELQKQRHLRAFGAMLNAATWSIDVKADGEIVRVAWSDEFRRMLGYGDEADFPNTFGSWSGRLHPEDREGALRHFGTASRNTEEDLVYNVEYRIRNKGGEYRWFHAYGRTERNDDGTHRIYGIVTDVSAERELAVKNARFEVVKGIVHAALWNYKIDARDEVVAAEYSDDLPKLVNTDLRPDRDNPYQWTEIVHPDDRAAAVAAFKASIADHGGRTPYDVVYRMVDRNGKYNWFHSAGSVIRHEDGTGDFFGIHIDVTKTIEHEQEQEREIQEAKALEKANKAKSFFFSMVSHDIRTPLNAIIGYAELLKLGMADEAERCKAVDSVLVSGRSLLELINDVLDLSKLEAGKMEILPEPVDAARLVQEVADTFRATIGGKPLEIRTRVGTMPWLKLDPHRVRQILFNLVGNAVKFTEEGYIEISADYAPGGEGRGTFCFSVRDTGCGISEEDQERVALPYVQVGHDTSHGKGTGLGLAICKQLVRRMGGEFGLESALGRGSTFTVSIPDVGVDVDNQALLSTTQRIHLAVGDEIMMNQRVLVVDDVSVNRMVLKTMLGKFGIHDVEMAENGFDALKKLRESPVGPFDLVLTDMWMPGMDGERLVREIRKDPVFARLPVYAVTADVEAQKDYARMGFTGILLKPLTLEKIGEFFRSEAIP